MKHSTSRPLGGVGSPDAAVVQDAPLGIFVHWGPYSVPAWAEDHGELGVEDDWEAVVYP